MQPNKIYCGDCIELMKQIENDSIDLIIADPPYNVSRENNFQTMGPASRIGMDFGEWDKGFNQEEWIGYLPRILKENANVVVFNDWKNLTNIQETLAKNNIIPKRCLVLNKSNPAPFNRDRMFVNEHMSIDEAEKKAMQRHSSILCDYIIDPYLNLIKKENEININSASG